MKKQLLTGLFTVFALAASAQSNEWRNPQVNAVNRAPMHTNYFAYENADAAKKWTERIISQLYDAKRRLEVQLGERCRRTPHGLLENNIQ